MVVVNVTINGDNIFDRFEEIKKINCADLSDDELNSLKIKTIPTTMIYDNDDNLIARFDGNATTTQIIDRLK